FTGPGDVARTLLTMAGATHVAELRDSTSADRPIRIVPLPSSRFYFADQISNLPLASLLSGAPPTQAGRAAEGRGSAHIAFTDLPPFTPAPGRILQAASGPNAID